jgi:hypothetical protein
MAAFLLLLNQVTLHGATSSRQQMTLSPNQIPKIFGDKARPREQPRAKLPPSIEITTPG